MSKDDLKKLIDNEDWYGLMLASIRIFLGRYHPISEYAALVIRLGEGIPDVREVVRPRASSGPSPRPS